MNKPAYLFIVLLAIVMTACKGGNDNGKTKRTEDLQAKNLLQGIWVDNDEENVVFKVKGDTIFYPDSLSQPIRFAIYGDTLEMENASNSKYAILKQTAHIFEFKNQNGDVVKLVKGEDPSYELLFQPKRPMAVNQNKVLKSDSVVFCSNDRFHSYIQVNPTKYKVYKTSYNSDGMEIENIYFDNTIHVGIFKQQARIFSRDFAKKDFSKYVPAEFLKQSVLSDIILTGTKGNTLCYQAQLAIPDSDVSYIVNIDITTDGEVSISIQK